MSWGMGWGSAVIQAGQGEARLQCSKQAGICTALITAALEGRRVDSWGGGEERTGGKQLEDLK